MTDSRREFLKKAALLAGGTSLFEVLPDSIQKALAIDPQPGSTFLDAKHVVILMQENRSFDHCYGTLQGVRGFNDPRAITLPNKNPVWLQTNGAGETYAPFRLNLKDTKATWMSSLPHSWTNQVDARNNGKYDKWLDSKRSGHKEYAKMPLTMGYYNREDIPFYYALADAFTVCDQNFCSSLTGTTPNRLYLWTGTIREKPERESKANVRNEDVDYGDAARWTTFPERLEDNGISWKIYQNELSLPVGFEGEQEGWLANFTDNPIEWFEQYNVGYSAAYQKYLEKRVAELPTEIQALTAKIKSLPEADSETDKLKKELTRKEEELKTGLLHRETFSRENYEKLSQRLKNLHNKAFTTNKNDPDYHSLTSLKYHDGSTEREVEIPKGDVLHQFRADVKNRTLPTVSWVVAPENFSDHPGAAWYGAWYISEMLDILTQNPDVWKKTVFILCYDENDGYFDHVPPFVAPHPDQPETGTTSKGIDTGIEHVFMEQELKRKGINAKREARASSIGLGYRVPLVIASPWSRGGMVSSEVFDHTSILQFLEVFLNKKTGKKIEESNISAWRRTVCGDLTSVFRPYKGEKIPLPTFVAKNEFVESIHKAQFKQLPAGFKELTKEEISQIRQSPMASPLVPNQEKGVRAACALPYQLYADGKLSADKKAFGITFQAKKDIFGAKSAGSPFTVYALDSFLTASEKPERDFKVRDYAVTAGDSLTDSWPLADFEKETYHFRVNGPNGFFREYIGDVNDPALDILCDYQRTTPQSKQLTGSIELKISNLDKSKPVTIEVKDNAYKTGTKTKAIAKGSQASLVLDLGKSFGWYDFSVKVSGSTVFEKRFAGHVETGKPSFTDPVMGGTIV
ncbi:phosphocholine-specific phospholipase C [Larkinella terrae]|uniref:phospholipase C n=1 Tax=Larkinella terrae TaxID=2025311 RepID=A0A7K0EM83_9BACT|nr:phospholipase C, phosphocholine-specific [Larkinella terrae]MRS62919.1 phospholipase C, phosphocholine-specific [Larkinella terrae]